jgi:hypothetical protein
MTSGRKHAPVSKALDEWPAAMAVVRAHEVQMDRPRVVGIETRYIGGNHLLRGALVHVESVIRGSVRDRARRTPEVTDDEELWRRPVAPEDEVRVRCPTGLPKVVQAPELECFAYLAPAAVERTDVGLEREVLATARMAASAQRRPLDAFVNDAVARELRALGLLRTDETTAPGAERGARDHG